MKLIIGLGNIGSRYAKTRHNIGFIVVDKIAENLGASWKHESKLHAELASVELAGEKLILAKPDTFMNLSGDAVQRILQFYKLTPGTDLWVAFDDLDVPFGRMRLRFGGSSGGHQGLNSTIAHIGPNFVRVRIGISLNDRTQVASEVYVLSQFDASEQPQLPKLIEAAAVHTIEQLSRQTPEETTFDLVA